MDRLSFRPDKIKFVFSLDHKQVDLFYMGGNRGNKWQRGMVSLFNPDTANKTSKIVISGIRGWDFTGDIAIDDIKFHNCDFLNALAPCTEKFAKCNDKPFTRPTLGTSINMT